MSGAATRATTDSGDITYPWLPLSHTHLQRCLRVKFKLRDELGPRLEFLGLWVYVIVKDGSLGGKFDGLELVEPPFAELCPVVHELPKQSKSGVKALQSTRSLDRLPCIRQKVRAGSTAGSSLSPEAAVKVSAQYALIQPQLIRRRHPFTTPVTTCSLLLSQGKSLCQALSSWEEDLAIFIHQPGSTLSICRLVAKSCPTLL